MVRIRRDPNRANLLGSPTQAAMGTERRRTLDLNQEPERRPTTHQEQEAAMSAERRRTLEPNQEPERRPTTDQEQEAAMGTERRRTLEPHQEFERCPTTHQEQAAMGSTRRRTLEPNQEPERRPTTHHKPKKRRRTPRVVMDMKRRQTQAADPESVHLPGDPRNASNLARLEDEDAPRFSNHGDQPRTPNPRNSSNLARLGGEDAPRFSNHGDQPPTPNVLPEEYSDQRMPHPPPPPPPPPPPTKDTSGYAGSSHSSAAASVNQPSGFMAPVNQSGGSGGSSTLLLPLTLAGIPIGRGVIMAQAIYFPVGNIESGGSGATAPRQDAVGSGVSSNPAMVGSGDGGLHSGGGSQVGNGADSSSKGTAQRSSDEISIGKSPYN